MVNQKKWTHIMIGGLLVLVLALLAGAAFAQTDDGDDDAATPEATAVPDTTVPDTAVPGLGFKGNGLRGVDAEALAAALGITVEELQAAQEEARAAAIAQAVTDGLLTQEQADELLVNGFGGRRFHFGDSGTYLAEALGITVEELQAARNQVYADRLAELVAAGTITQEQADLMLARQAVQGYVDETAVQSAIQSIYQDAINQALADGVITQAQADQLLSALSEQPFGLRGFGLGGFGGGRGHHGHHGGPGFFGPGTAPDEAPAAESDPNA
jgi:formaldehyde-activating enzyme involved in methanogenesis